MSVEAKIGEQNVGGSEIGSSTGYKQTEVGIIPGDWDAPKLREGISLYSGHHILAQFCNTEGRGVPYLTGPADFPNGKIQQTKFTTKPSTLCAAGDILVTVKGSGAGKLTRADRAYCISRQLMAIQSNKWSLQFVDYAIRNSTTISAAATGLIPGISRNDILDTQIALPSAPGEQTVIAEALSDADALIEGLEKLIAKKRLIKQGATQELLTGKRRLPGVSGEWRYIPFRAIFDLLPTATNSRADLGSEGDAYYVHYGDIHTRFHTHIDFRVSDPPRISRSKCPAAATLRNGDWIMADASEDFDGVGKSVEVRGLKEGEVAVAGLHTFLLREREKTFVPGFKGHLSDSQYLRSQYMRVMTGMKVYGVSKTALRDLLVPVPPFEEQAAMVQIFDDVNKEIAALEIRVQKARQIKQGLMQELLTGRVRLV